MEFSSLDLPEDLLSVVAKNADIEGLKTLSLTDKAGHVAAGPELKRKKTVMEVERLKKEHQMVIQKIRENFKKELDALVI